MQPDLTRPARLRRRDASRYLLEKHGVTVAPTTLAKWAVVGGGPAYALDGRFPVYSPNALDAFARQRLGSELASNAAHRVAREGPEGGKNRRGERDANAQSAR